MLSFLIIFFSIVLESFPISSSGHIVLLQRIVEHVTRNSVSYSDFDYFLHGPIAFTIAYLFFDEWIFFVQAFPRTMPLLLKIFLCGVITDSITVAAYCVIKNNTIVFPLWIGFFITGLLLFSLLFCKKRAVSIRWNYKNAVLLGVTQAIALLPGISRLGATYVVSRWLGFCSRRAFQISFLIEWPLSFAAFVKGSYMLHKEDKLIELLQLNVILVMIVAIIIGMFGLRLMSYVVNKNLTWMFSVYVLLVAVATFLLY